MEQKEFFARSASGLEKQLARELKALGIKRVRPLMGGVAFFGSFEDAYRVCLWSRVASRVLYVLARIEARDTDTLYQGIQTIDWTEHINADATLAVHAHGTNDALRNTQYTAVRVKDAVCDQLLAKYGSRPDVQQNRPSVLIDVVLRAHKATIALDFSGEPLHRRAYREDRKQSEAPLKENLAAGIVLASGWQEVFSRGGVFVDPLCGSGTLAIEAALIAADKAPGILRDYWGFTGWRGFDPAVWEKLVGEAEASQAPATSQAPQAVKGLPTAQDSEKSQASSAAQHPQAALASQAFETASQKPLVYASDIDEACIALARKNAKRAGVADLIQFSVRDVADLKQAEDTGILVTNPPYGQRLLSDPELPALYAALAKGIESLGEGWQVAIITPDETIDSALGLAPFETLPFYNGKIETQLRRYKAGDSERVFLDITSLQGTEVTVALTERNSEQFAARLRKAAKERRKWARKNHVGCYRLYDADLPDYVVAIDWYEGAGTSKGEHYALVSEYKAPAEIDEGKASRRVNDVLKIVPALLDIAPEHVSVKTRRRDKGGKQYQDAKGSSRIIQINESGYLLEVDLGGYLDTGIFLDHRVTREMIGSLAQGKRFLNLFAYTGVATVHAAGGGAASTKTVDLSHTYLSWAERNMELNGFSGTKHSFERADITQWIAEEAAGDNRYDLIFVDPPTFSNSKAMKDASWSVQRDHVTLLAGVKDLLAEGGQIVFSCNLRSFKPDSAGLAAQGLAIKDITAETIPHDFTRTPKVHHCYLLSHQQ